MQKFIAALSAKRAQFSKDDKGFTLIELIVVVLIIGVLAAIAIPVFLGQQAQAKESAASANLANAKIAYSSFLAANNDETPDLTADLADLEGFGWPKDGSVTTGTATGAVWCLEIDTDESGLPAYFVTDAGAPAKGTCSTPAG